MVSPDEIGSAFSGMGAQLLPTLMKWIGIIILSSMIIGFLWMLWMWFQYNIGVFQLRLGKTERNGQPQFFIKSIKLRRARKVITKGLEKFQYLWSRGLADPIPDTIVLPYSGFFVRNIGFAYDIDGEIDVPSTLDFSLNSPATVSFMPLPYHVKRAVSLELQEIAKEYQDPGFMAKYGSLMLTLGAILFCLILAGVTVWLTYQYNMNYASALGDAAKQAGNLAESLKQGTIQKFAP